MIIAKLIHHPDGYFNVDGEVIPEDVFMDAFPSYPALPDGVTHRICVTTPANMHSSKGQIGCDEISDADLDTYVAAKTALVAERDTRYPNLFNQTGSGASFSLAGKWPPVPDPREVFDPAKRRAKDRHDSASGSSPAIEGTVVADPSPLVRTVAVVVAEVKAEANRRILAILPEWKQRNYLAYSLEVTRKEVKGNSLSAEEDATIAAIEAQWTFVKSVRAASDLIEAEILALTDAEAEAYDVANNPLWP